MALGKSILVLGASGASGLTFTKMVLERKEGPKLTLYVRSRSKVPPDTLSNPAIRLVEAPLTDEAALKDAMAGVDTVVSFLGAPVSLSAFIWRTKTTPIADSFPAVFEAMRSHGVRRILALSTTSYQISSEQKPWLWWLLGFMPPLFVPQGNAEMVAIARNIAAQSDLDWTVFRVPHLNNGPEDLPLAAGLLAPDYKGTTELSRPSLARWVMQEIQEGKWIKGAPVLGNY